MSDSLSHPKAEPDEVTALLGEPVGEVEVDRQEMLAVELVSRVRGLLAAAAANDRVGVNEIARRLDCSPAAVSRHLRGEGDMRFSTAVLIADVLGRHWHIDLRPNGQARKTTSNRAQTRAFAPSVQAPIPMMPRVYPISATGAVLMNPTPSDATGLASSLQSPPSVIAKPVIETIERTSTPGGQGDLNRPSFGVRELSAAGF